jgi:hypothetical protein
MTRFEGLTSSQTQLGEPDVHTITQSHVDELTTHVRRAKQQLCCTKKLLAESGMRLARIRLWRFHLKAAAQVRKAVAYCFGWKWAGLLLMASAVGALCFVLTSSWVFGLVGVSGGTLWAVGLLYVPADAKLAAHRQMVQKWVEDLEQERTANRQALAGLEQDCQQLSDRLAKWTALLEERRIRESAEYRRRNLLNANWKALRSVEFERFLEQVFYELGYTVEMTKVTGDQGGDLIVSKGGYRIAVQVKGYFHSVSNSAVQEAHTAKDYYSCHGSAVITNSRFTSGARDLAGTVGCVLIGEEELPALIMGSIDLIDLHRQATRCKDAVCRRLSDQGDRAS